jgi:dihydrodipicolinate synthase/N-acetylneuraminate lyase
LRPLQAEEIHGTWGTVLLPLRDDESIDLDLLRLEVDALIEAGLDGLYTNGTAGEFHAQTDEEFLAVNRVVAERCEAAAVPFEVGASHPSATTTLARLRVARELRPSAIQVILPDWVTVGEDEAISFLARLAAEADGIGLVLYNPPHAKRVLDPPAIGRLKAKVPQLVGVKVADGNPSWYGAARRHLAGLSVFVPGHHLATGLLAGAQGSYSNVACLSPAGSVRWARQVSDDPLAALDLERRIVDFFQEEVAPFAARGFSNPALDKLLAAVGNWTPLGTRLRWPHKWIAPEEVERLRPLARQALPDLFEA